MRLPGKRREYYKDDGANAATWTADGWLRTGDLAYLDADGFVYISGRIKDMIIRGGNNIYATDVEAVILEHPDVQEAAVIGVPHQVLGEDVGAFVVCKPGASLDDDDAARVLRRAPRRLQAAAPPLVRRRAPPQRHRQGDEAQAAGAGRPGVGASARTIAPDADAPQRQHRGGWLRRANEPAGVGHEPPAGCASPSEHPRTVMELDCRIVRGTGEALMRPSRGFTW